MSDRQDTGIPQLPYRIRLMRKHPYLSIFFASLIFALMCYAGIYVIQVIS